MLTSVLGVLLAASAATGPNAVRPEEVCLLRSLCDRTPVYCLVADDPCETRLEESVCLVVTCPPRGPELPGLQP